MGDMVEVFNDMKQDKKDRHAEWYKKNINTILAAQILCEVKDTVILFREEGKPKVDFYPHTGRWKANDKMFRGGADSFLKWYAKQ